MIKLQDQINKTIQIIRNLNNFSDVCQKSYNEHGRGAFLLYNRNIIAGRGITEYDYREKQEALEIFDNPASKKELAEKIKSYNANDEAVLILISDFNNATIFVTIALEKTEQKNDVA